MADPLGSVWFIPIGEVTSTEDLGDYLECYRAIGVETRLADCTSEASGPHTVVACDAVQQAAVLLSLDLDFPSFDMTFEVWGDGIRTLGWVQHDSSDLDTAFRNSDFNQFRNNVLIPEGLLQDNMDPIWSKENGERMAQLVDDFLAEHD